MTLLGRALDLVYPRECEICGRGFDDPQLDILCFRCEERVEWIAGRTCRRCGWGLAPEAADDKSCPECDGKEIAFKGAVAAGRFLGYVREFVHRFKFRRQMHFGRAFAVRLARRVREAPWGGSVDVVVPVPTRLLRLLTRTYSAAEVVAGKLAVELDRPYVRALRIVRGTESQTELTQSERLKNPAGAFAVRAARICGRRVLLVDDVLTTGATANECTRVLRDAGADSVFLAVIGR